MYQLEKENTFSEDVVCETTVLNAHFESLDAFPCTLTAVWNRLRENIHRSGQAAWASGQADDR